jgi:hypothetical protein
MNQYTIAYLFQKQMIPLILIAVLGITTIVFVIKLYSLSPDQINGDEERIEGKITTNSQILKRKFFFNCFKLNFNSEVDCKSWRGDSLQLL